MVPLRSLPISLAALLITHVSVSQDVPVSPATSVQVTVRQVGSRTGALPEAAVRLQYRSGESQQQQTDRDGVATFLIPVDASLAVLTVSHPRFRSVEMPYVQWERYGTQALTTITLRDRPPFPLFLRVQRCKGLIRPSCEQAAGFISLYRRGLPELVSSAALTHGTAQASLPFPPEEAEFVLVGSPEGDVHFFADVALQHLAEGPEVNLIVREGGQ